MEPMDARDLEVVLYGATGYTGRLIAHELDQRGATFAIAGRNPSKLEALSRELDRAPETVVASVDDPGALRAMAGRASCVLSAAGPFKDLGPPVVEAALSSGAEFVDITGEQGFLRWAWGQHQGFTRAGRTMVNAAGFDVVPSDVAAAAACRGLDQVVRLDLGIATSSGLSSGTQRTMAASTGDWWYWDDGRFKGAPAGRFVRKFDYPGLGESTSVFVPWGDVVTAPRSTGARVVRTFFRVKPEKARRAHLAWPITHLISKVPWVSQWLEDRAPGSGKGPSAEERERAKFTIVAEAHTPGGAIQRAVVEGRDPYGLTASASAQVALALANAEVDQVGVLTPSQLFPAEGWVKRLAAFDLSVDVAPASHPGSKA